MNNLLDIHHTIIQVNSICYRKKNFNYPTLWFFLDEDRIKDEIALLKNIPAKICIGVIVRTKNKKNLYKKAKKVAKICKLKGFKFFVSSYPKIALAVAADGVHFSQDIKKARIYKSLIYSSSFHKLSDLRRIIDLKTKKVFISPIFKTASRKLKKPIGLTRLLFLSRSLKCEIGVLGGINKKNIKRFRKKNISYIGGVEIFLQY